MNQDFPFIRNERQRRLLEVLLAKGAVPVKELRLIIGAQNPAHTVMECRKIGFLGIIITRFFDVLDRDEKICRAGEYYVPSEFKHILEEALKEYAAHKLKTRGTAKDAGVIDCSREGGYDSTL